MEGSREPEHLSLTDSTEEAARVMQQYQGQVEKLGCIRDRARRLQALLAGTEGLENLALSSSLPQNIRTMELLFADCSDWVMRGFRIAGGREACITYFDGLSATAQLSDFVLKPLLFDAFPVRGATSTEAVRQVLACHAISATELRTVETMRDVVDSVLGGDGVLVIDGEGSAVVVGARAFEHRGITEPSTEAAVRGPKEGFTESLRVNTSLLRRRICSSHLKLENLRVGRLSRTSVTIAYIRGIATDVMVKEVRRRVSRIEIDGIIDSAYIEELIEDDPYSPFPQVMNTERPDVVAAHLLEGRVALLVDGSPFVLIVPTTLWSLMQASEDYYERFYIATFTRWLRYGLGLFSLIVPSLYVAITTFHQEMLPHTFLTTLAASHEGVPFPSMVEALAMEFVFEALREAGIRLPRSVGQAVSIVGALVIGQTAVQAGIVSAPLVIVVATTGIASFAFPKFNLGIAFRLLRFPLMLLAGSLGLYGIMIGLLIVFIHLCGLRSFGIPYLAPLAPVSPRDLTDVAIRPPIWLRGLRPRLVGYANPRRQRQRLKPGPEPWENDNPAGASGRDGGKDQ